MKINADGLVIIKQFEGLRLKAYVCPAGVMTIGYGSTGSHVKPGIIITEAQADQLLADDLVRFEEAVALYCPVTTPNQYSALVSLSFNVGEGSLKDSTLRRMHNEGEYEAAAGQFARWNKAGGRVLAGLTKRRAAEAALYRRDA